MELKLPGSWQRLLGSEFQKDYFKELLCFVKSDYANNICYPKENEIFAAFEKCSFEDVNVVVIGQDPYHGFGQANGLCFSVSEEMACPPSLVNIFKEVQSDLEKPVCLSGDLTRWAKQGVLLLNATLTVRESEAGSHQKKGWEVFTDAVIQLISEEKKEVVFLLWGGFAKKKGKRIDQDKHCILESGHPSPLSANRGYWFGNKCFSKTNAYLKSKGKPEVQW
jgi:uracil-DNA glycosylase